MREKVYTRAEFKADLERVMPGFKWTVHKPSSLLRWDEPTKMHVKVTLAEKDAHRMTATGTKSSGFNRVATIEATYLANILRPFEVVVFGYGCRGPKIMAGVGKTVPQAFRDAQSKCEERAQFFGHGASLLKQGRTAGEADS